MNKVLVVNDCKFESMILNDMLSQMGYNVYITDEFNAMRHIVNFTPDIIMVNYIMKETSGDKLIHQIKIKHPNITCILSSSNKLDTSNLLKNNKIDAIIKTPIDRKSLLLIIDETSQKDNKVTIKSKLERWKQKAQTEIGSIAEMREVNNSEQVYEECAEQNRGSFCPYCGNHMSEEQSSFVFCPKCGKKL